MTNEKVHVNNVKFSLYRFSVYFKHLINVHTHAVHANDVVEGKFSTPRCLVLAGPPDFQWLLVFLRRMADQIRIDLMFA